MIADVAIMTSSVWCIKGDVHKATAISAQVDSCQELMPGSEEEVEIRACTVAAVEHLRKALASLHTPASTSMTQSAVGLVAAEAESHALCHSGAGQSLPNSVQLDWWLWEQGERSRSSDLPHHRTLTIYY